jgi:ribonuclease PH
MVKVFQRVGKRSFDSLRPVSIQLDPFGNALSAILFELGNTKVLAAISLQKSVPLFLRGSGTGWLTAEYSMLPISTHFRTSRDSSGTTKKGRNIEISRLIGRSLRSMVNLEQLGERTLVVDCDVLQADGSTRTACITAASLALQIAVQRMIRSGALKESIITDVLTAVSVGISKHEVLLDIDYAEDSTLGSDYNFVLNKEGNLVEIQGSCEGTILDWETFGKARDLAIKGCKELLALFDPFLVNQAPLEKKKVSVKPKTTSEKPVSTKKGDTIKKVPLFSLQNR